MLNFSEFLIRIKSQKNFKNINEFFVFYGGKRSLEITERTFRAIVHGQMAPTVRTFGAIFKQLSVDQRKDALVAYFKSALGDSDSREITKYLSESLSVSINADTSSLWTTGREAYFFSEKQLNFLASENSILRIYNHVVLHGAVPETTFPFPDQKRHLQQLVAFGLVHLEDGIVRPSTTLYRLPNQDNSPKELVVPATEFIIKHLNTFLAKEGSPGEQELGFSIHTCLRQDAVKIMEQMKHFKRWVQNFGLKEDHPDEVSFVWMDFGRIINRGRDY